MQSEVVVSVCCRVGLDLVIRQATAKMSARRFIVDVDINVDYRQIIFTNLRKNQHFSLNLKFENTRNQCFLIYSKAL